MSAVRSDTPGRKRAEDETSVTTPDALIRFDRRRNHRFRTALTLRFTLRSGTRGNGKVSDISSGGVLFRCGGRLPVGETIEVALNWPSLLNGECPLQLCVRGRILRSTDLDTAVEIKHYEFRTAASFAEKSRQRPAVFLVAQ